ncbi:PP2C family protein-serine/threonine phosphatase [Streptomyces sp. NPDC059906]|uniref:PP2C family protein-serine/threonine phosphatase n=1 Tax=Streptomyces sp. NPDC059906 TaxID=3346997 RepID=UPI00364D05C6
MIIPPRPALPPGRPRSPSGHLTWSAAEGGFQALVVWTERRPGHGEDAEPLAAYHRPTANGLLAVFDGSGGSGAAPAWRGPDGATYTSAWTGARVARLAAECWFQRVAAFEEPDSLPHLKHCLRTMLRAAPTGARSKITGSMRRVLPTTLAAVRYRAGDEGVHWQAIWAGDSRSYALLPGSGLHALTRDDTREADALDQLRQDPPMTNVICADRDFTLSAHRGEFREPCVLLAATDGFFGYVHTPAQFECVLLETLGRARDAGEWADLLRRAIQPATGDDASLSLAALGFADFGQLRQAFAERHADVVRSGYPHVPPGDGPEAVRGWQDRTWRTYRPSYEKFMPEVRE